MEASLPTQSFVIFSGKHRHLEIVFPSEVPGPGVNHSTDSVASALADHVSVLPTNTNVRLLPFFPRQFPLPETRRCFLKVVWTLVCIHLTLQPLQL